MPFVLRKTRDESNPLLPDAWGIQQTVGRLVYWYYSGGRTYFLVLFCRGGKYGCDGLDFFRYKGTAVPEFEAGFEGDEDYRNWRFHRGTVTKQIVPKDFTADASTDTATSAAHGLNNDDPVRVRSVGGALPTGLSANAKYYVINKTTNTLQLSLTVGGSVINLTSAGSGTLKIWKADAGFDDPDQGRPQFFPELNLTFSNICYIEGAIPSGLSTADEEPSDFAFGLRARRVADFDVDGNYLTNNFSANNARVFADIVLNELKRPSTRMTWASWFDFKTKCDVLIWYRTTANSGIAGTGLTGRYYNTNDLTGAVIATRTDATIDFSSVAGRPIGVNEFNFSTRWEGKIKPQYTELYTFKTDSDDGVRLWVDNNLIIDSFTGGPQIHTGQINLTGGTLYNIKFEYKQDTGPGYCHLKWSSPSLTEEVIPTARLYASDSQVKRYESHVVFTSGTQAGAALEEVMKRAPGWHWQDVNGKIKFLAPDRAVVHHFLYDPNETNERWNIAAKTFEAKPRASDERPNWRVHFYNDLQEELLEEKWVEGDRPLLREQQGGLPTDTSPARWGVMTRSLTERCAEQEMKIFSDPDREFTLRGQSDSYHVSKGDRVKLTHISTGESFDEPVECIVTAEGFGAGNADEKSYTLLPATFPLITDEPVV
jgi:hypothetical protein